MTSPLARQVATDTALRAPSAKVDVVADTLAFCDRMIATRRARIGRTASRQEAAARRDSYCWLIRELGERCEDCGCSVRELAVFECVVASGGTSLLCCPVCATQLSCPEKRHWRSVVLARSGRARPRGATR